MSRIRGAEWDEGIDYPEPCPMGCGGLTHDPGGGPCERCWEKVQQKEPDPCWRCGGFGEIYRRDPCNPGRTGWKVCFSCEGTGIEQ